MNTDIKNFVRNLEILLLLLSIVGIPTLFSGLGFILIFSLFLPNKSNSILVFFVIVFCFAFALTWNTRIGYGGIGLVQPLKNYLHHKETSIDIFYARISSLFILGIVIITYIFMLIYYKIQ